MRKHNKKWREKGLRARKLRKLLGLRMEHVGEPLGLRVAEVSNFELGYDNKHESKIMTWLKCRLLSSLFQEPWAPKESPTGRIHTTVGTPWDEVLQDEPICLDVDYSELELRLLAVRIMKDKPYTITRIQDAVYIEEAE